MKIAPHEAARFCRTPELNLAGVLLHGRDDGHVAACRRALVAAIAGEDADPMRLQRLDPAAVHRDPAALDTALRMRGFFGDRALVILDGATEALARALGEVLSGLTSEDAFLLVTTGALSERSELRRLFERARHLGALEVAAAVPTADEIGVRLHEHGLCCEVEQDALARLASLAPQMDYAAFDRLLETIALYSLGSTEPLQGEEVSSLLPIGLDGSLDAFVDAVASGHPERVGPLLQRVSCTGATAVTLLLALQRHFRQLMAAESGGSVWGARRAGLMEQLHCWRYDRLQQAMRMLYETDGRIRSTSQAPDMALLERCALRIAMMAGRERH